MSTIERQSSFIKAEKNRQRSIEFVIALGFGILLLLIFITAWLSLSQMHQNQLQLKQVLHEHVSKLELITQMRHSARERTIAMQKILLLEDPFEQDEIFIAFNRFGAQFARARITYIDLGLTDEEKAILDLQGQYSSINVPVQERIVDLMMRNDKNKAHRLLIEEAIPVQESVFTQLNKLHDLQKEAALNASQMQEKYYQDARSLILTFVTAIAALGILVAAFVFSRTRSYQRALYDTRERAMVTLQSIGEAVISTDRNGHVEYLNSQAEYLLGYKLSEIEGQSLETFLDLRQDKESLNLTELMNTSIRAGEFYYGAHGLALHTYNNNKPYLIELTAAPIKNAHGEITGTVIAMRDVTTLLALDDELSYQATHDSLTGLLNRREYENRLQHLLEQSRNDQSEHAVCYIDLDMFKAVNDTCGHIAGDELLRQLAMLLQESVRKTDSLARVGGDEFALLLQSCNLEQAKTLAENLLNIIEGFRFHWGNQTFNIGASIGIAPIRPDSGTLESIMQTADFACYSAKDAGRNRIYAADSDSGLIGKRRGDAKWMTRLNEALNNDQFELYYQEIKPLHDGVDTARHVELLLRLRDANGDIISPMAFIPAAERYHLMPLIDRWVITEATTLLSAASHNGMSQPWRININLSGQSLSNRRFLDFVLDQIESTSISTEHLCFEVTETSAISNMSSAIRFMNTLRGVGCHFALDDFGSGLSSFAYLKSLPIDSVKIDGVFIRDLENDMTHRAIVTSIASVARVMNISTIAEFVENEAICSTLKDIGVDYAQGYHFARPLPFEAELMKHPDYSI